MQRHTAAGLAALAAVLAALTALAQEDSRGDTSLVPDRPAQSFPAQRGIPLQRDQISLQQAIEIARRQNPGWTVVSADTRMRNGRVVHEIRILGENNRVRTVQIDAQSRDSR